MREKLSQIRYKSIEIASFYNPEEALSSFKRPWNFTLQKPSLQYCTVVIAEVKTDWDIHYGLSMFQTLCKQTVNGRYCQTWKFHS